MDVAGGMPVD